mgnify:CR=1 FL=1
MASSSSTSANRSWRAFPYPPRWVGPTPSLQAATGEVFERYPFVRDDLEHRWLPAMFGDVSGRHLGTALRAAWTTDRPDLVIHDILHPAAGVVADELGIPSVRFGIGQWALAYASMPDVAPGPVGRAGHHPALARPAPVVRRTGRRLGPVRSKMSSAWASRPPRPLPPWPAPSPPPPQSRPRPRTPPSPRMPRTRRGSATIAQTGKNTTVSLSATGLGAGMHMHHIRGVRGGHATCPTAALDTNGDGRVDLREGLPAYGPVA